MVKSSLPRSTPLVHAPIPRFTTTNWLNLQTVPPYVGSQPTTEKNKKITTGSSECFGDTGGESADEKTLFHPRSPYGVAKAAAYWETANYREAYQFFACTGILFNHESPLRPERFVTRKIVSTACRIAAGSKEKLSLGNMSIRRDWGWAPEYVEAMWQMLQQSEPEDYVIATGETRSLQEFVEVAFSYLRFELAGAYRARLSIVSPNRLDRRTSQSFESVEKIKMASEIQNGRCG